MAGVTGQFCTYETNERGLANILYAALNPKPVLSTLMQNAS